MSQKAVDPFEAVEPDMGIKEDYDPEDDRRRSFAEALRAVRARVLSGGPGWEPHKLYPLCDGCDCERKCVKND